MTKVLSKDDLLSGKLLRRKLTYIEDWDASVWLRELSGDVIREYKRRIQEVKDAGQSEVPDDKAAEMMCYLLANSICGEDGELWYTEEQARGLTVNSLNTLTDIVNKIFEISGAKQSADGDVVSEVAAELPNDPTTSSQENSPSNLD